MSHSEHSSETADYHGHPNYIVTWGILVALLVVSLALGHLGHKQLAITLIFMLAVVKAVMVLGNFMHLRYEPKVMWVMMLFALMCAGFFFFGVYPDVVKVPLQLAK